MIQTTRPWMNGLAPLLRPAFEWNHDWVMKSGGRGLAELLGTKVPSVDILVNNLGIFEPKRFEQIPDDDWRRFFEVNVLSGVRLSRMYLPGMKDRGWGRIVFISSESAINTPGGMIHYGMTKTAQLAVSRGLAESCAGTAVTVNAVLPGPTHSPGVDEFVNQLSGGKPFAEFEKEFFKTVRPTSLLKRFIKTEEVASLVAYVCSPLAAATNGAALRVDGGVAVPADHEGLAPFLGHELSPRGLWLSRLGEIGERADVVHVHLGPLRAPFISSRPEPEDHLFAFAAGGERGWLAVL